MPKQVVRFHLPFVVPAVDRKTEFTREMETATIFCLAETERERGGGLILKRAAEEILFIAEVYYPLWLIPWRTRTLLFDGFGIITHTLSFDVLPDVQAFTDELQGSEKISSEAYAAFLSDHLNYFRGFADKKEQPVEGLIAGPPLFEDLVSYLPEAKVIRKRAIDKVILSPTLDESAISYSIHELSAFRTALKNDFNGLRQTMKLLSTITKKHARAIREEINKAQPDFEKDVEALRSSVSGKTRKIQMEYDRKITECSENFDKLIQSLHGECIKAEKDKQRLQAEMERCETEIRAFKLRNDEAGVQRWTQDLKKCEKDLSILDKNISDLNKSIEEANTRKNMEISRLRAEYKVEAEAAMEELRKFRASHEAEVQLRQQLILRLEDLSSTIINQADKLLEQKRAAFDEFGELGIPKRRRTYALVHLPFHLACYRRERERRYMVFPPSIASGLGVLTRFKGVFGAAKIKSLLEPRSKPITKLLNQLIPLISRNPVFEKEIDDAGARANILRRKETCKRMKKGLEELRGEEWISESEFAELSSIISK